MACPCVVDRDRDSLAATGDLNSRGQIIAIILVCCLRADILRTCDRSLVLGGAVSDIKSPPSRDSVISEVLDDPARVSQGLVRTPLNPRVLERESPYQKQRKDK